MRPISATFDLSDHADLSLVQYGSSVAVKLTGTGTLDATLQNPGVSPPRLAVTLTKDANLRGSFDLEATSSLTMSGADGAKHVNSVTDTLKAAMAVIDTNVVGSGTFVLTEGFIRAGHGPSRIEFGGFVSGGQTIDISGGISTDISRVTIDNPKQFHAKIDLQDLSLADFVGLAQADSWSYRNDLLTIKNAGGQVVDKFHVSAMPPAACMACRCP